MLKCIFLISNKFINVMFVKIFEIWKTFNKTIIWNLVDISTSNFNDSKFWIFILFFFCKNSIVSNCVFFFVNLCFMISLQTWMFAAQFKTIVFWTNDFVTKILNVTKIMLNYFFWFWNWRCLFDNCCWISTLVGMILRSRSCDRRAVSTLWD